MAATFRPQHDARGHVGSGKFQRVVEEIAQALLQQGALGLHAAECSGNVKDAVLQRRRYDDDFVDELTHVDRRELHVLAHDAAELQQIARQRVEPLARPQQPAHESLGGLGHRGGVVVEQDFRESLERANRCAQIVGDGVGEAFELGDGFVQPGRALGNFRFQDFRVLAQLILGFPQDGLAEGAIERKGEVLGNREQELDLLARNGGPLVAASGAVLSWVFGI
jgi:hypothetical protein